MAHPSFVLDGFMIRSQPHMLISVAFGEIEEVPLTQIVDFQEESYIEDFPMNLFS